MHRNTNLMSIWQIKMVIKYLNTQKKEQHELHYATSNRRGSRVNSNLVSNSSRRKSWEDQA